MKSQEELLREAQARGAILIDDTQPGSGFADDLADDVACIGGKAGAPEQQMRYDDPAVMEMQKRAEDAAAYLSNHAPAEIDEANRRLRQENTNLVRKYRFNFQEEYTDWVPGRVLKIGDFLKLLQSIRPDAFVSDYQIMGLRGLGFIEGVQPKYSGIGIMDIAPEWSQLRLDRYQQPVNLKYRGWRDVLLTCIKGGFLTESKCDLIFGKPSGPRSRPWYRQLYAIRNNSCGECHKQFCECGYSLAWDRLRSDAHSFSVPEEVAKGKRQEVYESRIFVP